MPQLNFFKTCPGCGQKWILRDELLHDPSVSLLGYQVHFTDYRLGLFYFNHNSAHCQTTFALNVSEFMDMYSGPVYPEVKMADDDCPMYCLRRTETAHCHQPCAGAFVREIMQMITEIHELAASSTHSAVC